MTRPPQSSLLHEAGQVAYREGQGMVTPRGWDGTVWGANQHLSVSEAIAVNTYHSMWASGFTFRKSPRRSSYLTGAAGARVVGPFRSIGAGTMCSTDFSFSLQMNSMISLSRMSRWFTRTLNGSV